MKTAIIPPPQAKPQASPLHKTAPAASVVSTATNAHVLTRRKATPAATRPVNRYAARGVSASKSSLHSALAKATPAAQTMPFPTYSSTAFTTAVKDFLPATPNLFFMHADGAGSKTVLAYLYWKETGSTLGFQTVMHDALVMNTDDLLTTGACDNFIFTSTIARHAKRIPSELIATMIQSAHAFSANLATHGISAQLTAGETADLGEAVHTLTVDASAATWLPPAAFIDAKHVQPGALIVGLASSGQTSYEHNIPYNSGIGSNGLTSARHELLKKPYLEKYPETVNDHTPTTYLYAGDHALTDALPTTPLDIGKALLSPTRTYLPVIKAIFRECAPNYAKAGIQAIFHLTGGGQTKCLRFGKNIHYVKNNLFPLPPLFKLLYERTPNPQEFFQVYNAGHRLELVVANKKLANMIIAIAKDFKLSAQIIGYTAASPTPYNTLTLTDPVHPHNSPWHYSQKNL